MTSPTLRSPTAAPGVGMGWRHPHYAALLEQRPALDFIEVHSENFFAPGGAALSVLLEGRENYPVSLHGVGLSLGSAAGVDPWHLDQLARLVRTIEPVRVSDHASFARGPGLHASDLLPVPLSRAALDVMCDNVSQVQDRLHCRIAVENLSAYVQWRDNEMDEPTFLNALARRTGCLLLIDVNNVYVNTLNAQLRGEFTDPLTESRRWLDAIAPQHVAELHLAGHVHCGDIVIDDHGSRVCEAVWSLYAHALQRYGAVPTLIEWDTDLPELQVLLDEVDHARAVSVPGQPLARQAA